MADIILPCPKCGHQQTVSEFVAAEAIQCAKCGTALEIPMRSNGSPLKLRDKDALEPQNLGPSSRAQAAPPPPSHDAPTMADVYKSHGKVKKTRSVWAWMVFVILTAVFIGFQSAVREDAALLSNYNWFRGILAGLIYLLVVMTAFEDSVWQGLLSLVIPPYCIFYALVRLDSYMLRNLFLAVIVAFCAELYFIPENAFITHVQNGMSAFIRSIEGMIQRAGDAPTFE